MDYQKCYNNLIYTRKKLNRTKTEGIYYESHHILPKSMGGDNTKENLILLTPREHFVSHWLLYKIHKNRAMASAFFRMCQKGNGNMQRYTPSSRIYEEARLVYIEHNVGRSKHTEEGKKSIGLKNSKPKPEGYGDKISLLMSNGLAEKIGIANKGISRNKGRKITWDVGRPKSIIQQIQDGIVIKTWVGIEELQKEYSISRIYNAFKTEKPYKGYLWKKLQTEKTIIKHGL